MGEETEINGYNPYPLVAWEIQSLSTSSMGDTIPIH